MRAEIDAFVARELYGLSRGDMLLIVDSFIQLAGIEVKRHGEFLTRRLVSEAFDRADWTAELAVHRGATRRTTT